MKNPIQEIKKRPILQISLILIGGFFLSRLAFVALSGNAEENNFFGWEGAVSLGVVMLALFAALFVGIRNHKGK